MFVCVVCVFVRLVWFLSPMLFEFFVMSFFSCLVLSLLELISNFA